nr:hypothetical protein [Gracilaria edulis]
MNNSHILIFFRDSVKLKSQEIVQRIKLSKEYSHEYFLYKSNLRKSKSEGDWRFCILILKFTDKNFDPNDLIEILKYFLYRDRYRNKFINHHNYLIQTIKKVISYCVKQNLIGSLIIKIHNDTKNITDVISNKKSDRLFKSISKSDIIKVCNIFNFFYLNSRYSFDNNISVTCSESDNNFLKVYMQNGLLNYFDLMVLICILRQYNNSFSTFKFDTSLQLNLIGYDSGYSRKKLLSSLKKLSMTIIECCKQYLKFEPGLADSPEKCFYTFSGNLLNVESLCENKLTSVNIQLSLPLIHMFEANNSKLEIFYKFT